MCILCFVQSVLQYCNYIRLCQSQFCIDGGKSAPPQSCEKVAVFQEQMLPVDGADIAGMQK